MIWGALFVFVGIFIILNVVFGINIPALKVGIAVFVILVGVKIIMGPSFETQIFCGSICNPSKGNVIFGTAEVRPMNLSELVDNEFSTIFGQGELDLTKTGFESPASLTINTVFGKSRIFLPANLNIVPKVNSIVGSVNLPGESKYPGAEGRILNVEVNNIFGSTQIEKR